MYLINIKKFEKLLPIGILWYFSKYRFISKLPVKTKTLINQITGKGYLDSWEDIVTNAFKKVNIIEQI